MANPFEDMDLSEEEDTYASMESFRLPEDDFLPLTTDKTVASQYSDMPLPEIDGIDEEELMKNVAEDTFPPGSLNSDGRQGINTPDSHTIPQASTSSFARAGRTGQSEFVDYTMFGLDSQYREEVQTKEYPHRETPAVVRKQMQAMEYLAQGQAFDGDRADEPSISEAVTETTVPNFFKKAHEYSSLANPNAQNMELQLFSRIGPATKDMQNALEALAYGENNPLSSIVEIMAYTVEFQTYELSKVKSSGIDIFQKSNIEDHNNWSEVDSRRSMCIRTLLGELDNKEGQFRSIETQLIETKSLLETERRINSEFRRECERIDPSVSFSQSTEGAFKALTNVYKKYQRNSDAKAAKQRMEIEEYAERLLEYEKRLSKMQREKNEVIAENTSLKVELASHAESDQCHHKLKETHINCKLNSGVHHHAVSEETESWYKEKTTLTEEISVLHKDLRKSQNMKDEVEDELFKVNIDLEEARRRIKSLKTHLSESETNEKLLRESRDHLQKHSREVAKELSQNTIEAALEIDRKETEISHLRFELEDREAALKSYKERIIQLQDQISKITNEAIRRGQSANDPATQYESELRETTSRTFKESSFTKNMQREYDDAKDLISEKTEEVDSLSKKIKDMERSIKMVEDECEMWKSQAQSAARECESLKQDDMFEAGETQQNSFLRRLSTKLNVQGNSRRDILRQLVDRIEELIQERSVLEETKEKLNGRIVEREKMIVSMRSEYQSEISALNVNITQLQHACQRAEADRKEVEEKLDQIASLEDTMGTQDDEQFTVDEDEGYSIKAAKKAVEVLVGSKLDLDSDVKHLSEKLNGLMEGGVTEGGSTIFPNDIAKQARDTNDELLKVIGQQQKTIKKLRRTNTNAGGQGDDATWQSDTFTTDSTMQTNTYTQRSSGQASAFIRTQLNEVRDQLTEKTNDNTKLSTAIKEMGMKMQAIVNEKNLTQSQFEDLSALHTSFVKNLAGMLQVNATTVTIETTVKQFISMTDVLRDQITDARSLISQQSTRMVKFGAQKRVLEHMIGIYQRKYHLNILAIPTGTKKSTGISTPKRKWRSCVYAIRAKNRILELFKARNMKHKPQEYVDITKMYSLPGAHRIADGRLSTIPIDNALLALQSVEKLRKALASKNQEINDLRQSLTTLDHSLPLPTSSTAMPESKNMNINFDYNKDMMERKNIIEQRLKEALDEKEQVEKQLSHERTHRLTIETRAKKYSDKARKLHKQLQTAKITMDNRERTYKSAIKYFKQRAESAINEDYDHDHNYNCDFENAEPNERNQQAENRNRSGTEIYAATSSSSSVTTKTRSGEHMSDLVKYLSEKLEKESKLLETMEKGTGQRDEQKSKVNGIRATLKNLRSSTARSTTQVSAASTKVESSMTMRTKSSGVTTEEGGSKVDKNTPMADL